MKQDEIYIGIFGKRNQGKSSLMNLLTGQQISIVSETPGTTTDPVKKSCEIFGMGKCVFVDTAGFDDEASGDDVGPARVQKTIETINRLDLGILLVSENTLTQSDKAFASMLSNAGIPFMILHNKSDVTALSPAFKAMLQGLYPNNPLVDFSVKEALLREFDILNHKVEPESQLSSLYVPIVDALTGLYRENGPASRTSPALQGLVEAGDHVVLVCPIDSETPTDRLILPQVLFARQCMDFHAVPHLCQPEELALTLKNFKKEPKLVITDSQVFGEVGATVPENIPLTSFSICLAKQKGNFDNYLQGTDRLAKLKNGAQILILESCTHQVNCNDIGRVKLPEALRKATGKKLNFTYISGLDPLPDDLSRFALAIQCGGCMVGARQLETRVRKLVMQNVAVSNYGMTLAWCSGIFERSTQMFR